MDKAPVTLQDMVKYNKGLWKGMSRAMAARARMRLAQHGWRSKTK